MGKFNSFGDGPKLKTEPIPTWVRNEPAADYVRSVGQRPKKCLTCRFPVGRSGLCVECFFKFWAKRLQFQKGKWLTRDVPRVPEPALDNLPGETCHAEL